MDGWIYALFCAERKDKTKPDDSSAAVAGCGIARTRNLIEWERLPDLRSAAQQQRNCVLHPEFVNGKYMIYTRPQSGFIETGDSGISVGFADTMNPAIIKEEAIMDPRVYHTVKEVKNGQRPPPLKTELGVASFGTRGKKDCSRTAVCFISVPHRPGRTELCVKQRVDMIDGNLNLS